MKNKKVIFRISIVLLLVITVFSIVLKAGNTNKTLDNKSILTFAPSDTLKPDVITEKRTTKIEIINGKKKVVEKIVKMRGDSIVEEKTIEREEDVNDNQDFGQNSHIQGFNFNQIDPMNLDSIFGMNFKLFTNPLVEDSLFQGFGLKFEPGFHMGFGDSFTDDDFLKNFFQNPGGGEFEKLEKQLEEFFQNHSLNSPLISPNKEPGYAPKKKFKSLKEIIREQLLNDGFIKDLDDSFKFDITDKKLKINGKGQSKDVFEKYKKVIEDNSGLELEGEFEYKFKNSKSLKNGIRKI